MSNEEQQITRILEALRDPHTIRVQAHRILDRAKQNKLKYFALDPEKMSSTAAFVINVITSQYPDLDIPYHSRWRHFEAGGINRIQLMQPHLAQYSPCERGKILYELVIISVLLDAGAGKAWHYQEPGTQNKYTRSEGLALATLSLYQNGLLSGSPQQPFRVDAQRLIHFKEQDLLQSFQVTSSNPLEGVTGRVDLLNRLGIAITKHTEFFGTQGRLGDFYSYISSLQTHNTLSAQQIFQAILNGFNDIWPVRLLFHNVSLGDSGIHSALKTTKPGSEFIPFHKLSQWLAYSLIEPLEHSGIKVTDLEALTALPEYRNGGLLIDTGLLIVKNPDLMTQAHNPDSEFIVEWRALTVALLDELADLIRKTLHKDASSLPMSKILQGGTWEAGRQIAEQKRPQGTPPIHIISDGTVF